MTGWIERRRGPKRVRSASSNVAPNLPVRSSRRVFPISATSLAIGVVVVLSGWLLFGFSARAQSGHDVALTASRLETVVAGLDATEAQLAGANAAVSELITNLRADVTGASNLSQQLSGDADVAQRVAPKFREYRAAVEVQLDLLARGQLGAAERVDIARVDPALDQLKRALVQGSATANAQATSALRWLRNGSALVLLGAGGLIALIARRNRRRLVRTVVLSERAQVVAASERRFRALIDNGDDVIIVTDRDGVIQEISEPVSHVLGLTAQGGLGHKITDLVHPDEIIAAEAEFARVLSSGSAGPSEWRVRDGDGAWRHIEASMTNLLALPEVAAVVLNMRDVNERHRLEEELRHRAFHDSLTGLANRALLRDRIDHAMARRDTCEAALMVLDLDGFKHLNDSLGHLAGDHALAVVADRLRGVSRPGDTVARLGGDEFALLIEEPMSQDQLQLLGGRLIEALAQPFEWENHSVVIGASVGVAFVEVGLHNADDLIRNADVGLYAAKAAGRGQVRAFDSSMFDVARTRFELEHDLADAIDKHEMVLQYQPIVELSTGRPNGFEALVRWQHPTRGMLAPDEFIPIAEETGLIVPLGRWVLNRACRDLANWTQTYPQAVRLYVSVNLSAHQLQDPHIVADVQAALADTALEPSRLVLEITESALMHDMQAALMRLTALKALGIRLSVDDFGTGYSSLSYLKQFPIDTVKIDKSFVDEVYSGADDATFVGAILRLSEALHLDTLAEGIETEDQANTLKQLGCHLGQGYHYAKPLDPSDVDELLRTQTATSTQLLQTP
ncbi:MAG: diguanylate cyclase/phosphodiesterase with sensor(s) [Actinomycetia bacterium]|nr:diguanylate cyclase/phosphodiesterase with sensor(s) [Actinomycetes bacterium]